MTMRPRVVVLGADGLDPGILSELIAAGRLPALARLAANGGPHPMRTSYPSASPVAWSSFISGKNPGAHGIFDFLERDRATYLPRLSLTRVRKGLFGIPSVQSNRRGGAFWDAAAAAGLETSLLFLPVTFPATRIRGRVLTGLGTPDIRGSWGTYSIFSTRLGRSEETVMGGVLAPIALDASGSAAAALEGPLGRTLDVRFTRQTRDGVEGVEIRFGGRAEWVAVGRFSGWFEPAFRMFGLFRAWGLCRFHVLEAGRDVEIYCSPIQLHPCRPPLPISAPGGFARELFSRHGLFKTLGWDMDTWALEEGHLPASAFLEDLRDTIAQRSAIVLDEVRRREFDIFVGVLQETDLVQHVFWRHRDALLGAGAEAGAIAATYEAVDRLAASMLETLAPGDSFFLMSDHGFGGFHRSVNLNSVLRDGGFLTTRPGSGAIRKVSEIAPGKTPAPPEIDWGGSSAYSYGLGNIWLNVRGREGLGRVEPGRDYMRHRDRIAEAFLALRDPVTGQAPVRAVYRREQLYSGVYFEEAPDLLIGFADGFRASWDCALGGVSAEALTANAGHWRGDHCSRDPAITSGVLLANRPLARGDPSLVDMAPTLLALVGVTAPAAMEGRSLV